MAFFPDADHELEQLREATTRQHATATRVGVRYNEDTRKFEIPTEAEGARLYALAYDLSQYQKRYWWLKPILQYAMAKTGIAPDSATAKQAAVIGAKVKADEGFGFQEPGTSVKAAAVAASMAASGQGAAYAGSYDLGYEARDLSTPDSSYYTHYLDNGQNRTLKYQGDTGIGFEFDPETGKAYTEQELSRSNPETQAASEEAKKVIAELEPNRAELSESEMARLNMAYNTQGITDEGLSDLVDTFRNPVTAGFRAGFMVLDAPLQELQGQVRNAYALTHGEKFDPFESQSDLLIAGENLAQGKDVDTGTGFFVNPESGLAKQRHERERQRGSIGDHSVTAGRWIANQFFDPDTTPFQVLSGITDTAIALKGDPSAVALTKVGEVRAAKQMFTEAGGLRGLRRTFSPEAVTKWISGDGRPAMQWLAKTNSVRQIREVEAFKQVDPAVLVRFADAHTEQEVFDVALDVFGKQVRFKPKVPMSDRGGVPGAVGATAAYATKSIPTHRMWNGMPARFIDSQDGRQAVDQVERFLRNVKAPESYVDDYIDKMARAETPSTRFKVTRDMMSDTKDLLTDEWGLTRVLASKLTKQFEDVVEDARKYFVDEIGDNQNFWGDKRTLINGTEVDAVSPHLVIEHIDRLIPLPDARKLRRATSRLRPLLVPYEGTPSGSILNRRPKTEFGQRLPVATMQWLQDEVWKPAQLLRAAWTLRVVGEEQIRMGAAGLDSLFRHPLSAIAWDVGRKGKTGFTKEKSVFELLNETEQGKAALSKGAGGFLDKSGRAPTGNWKVVNKTDEQMDDYLRGWADEHLQLLSDPVAQQVVKADNLGDAEEWFIRGPGQKFRQQLIESGHTHVELPGGQRIALDSVEGGQAYIASVARRISVKTGDHPELLDALRTGKLDGHSLTLLAEGYPQVNPKFRRALEKRLDHGPDAVKVEQLGGVTGELKARWDNGVQAMFGFLMAKPTNYLSRSPAFRQFYWKHTGELLPHMKPAAQAQVLAAAEAANLDKGLMKQLRKATEGASGELALKDADMVAKGHALDATRDLLYDLSEKSQFFDVFRLIFPFGEAWKEVLTRWSKLAVQRPQTIRRAQQIIQGARGSDLGALAGSPDGKGFFYQNERGEEVFVYPGSKFLTSKFLGGMPVPLVGRVSGLNLVGNVWPGIGPAAQYPIAAFLPDKPEYDWIRDTLFPYGEPKLTLGGVATAWAPQWLTKVLTPSFTDDPEFLRIWANSTMDVATYLASTGDYNLSDPADMQRLEADAKEKAKTLSIIRGVAQSFSPSAPAPDFLVHDKSGNLTRLAHLEQEWTVLLDKERNGEIESAAQAFLDTFGTEPFLTMQAKTQSVAFGYPTDSVGLKWMREHPEYEKKFPNMFGFFAPKSDDPKDWSYDAYLRALSSGAKNPFTLHQFVALGNATVASLRYDKARKKVEEASGGKPSTEQRQWLRRMRDALIREYPGYGESLDGGLGLDERANKDQKMRELINASADPGLAATPVGGALKRYLDARQKVIVESRRLGAETDTSFRSTKNTRHLRDWLRRLGSALANETPEFAPLWEQVLDREMNEDLDTEQQEAA